MRRIWKVKEQFADDPESNDTNYYFSVDKMPERFKVFRSVFEDWEFNYLEFNADTYLVRITCEDYSDEEETEWGRPRNFDDTPEDFETDDQLYRERYGDGRWYTQADNAY